MSVTFTKLFSSITESTVWCEPDQTRIVWITMLAMADRKGRIWASIPGLANRSRVSIEDTERALKTFLSPDPYSRTMLHEGRRIEEIDGGWVLINHDKYRSIMDTETVKESKRKYINNRRAEERESRNSISTVENVDSCRDKQKQKQKQNKPPISPKGEFVIPDWIPADLWKDYMETRKVLKSPMTDRAKQLAVKKLEELRAEGNTPTDVLSQSIYNGWKGLFPVKDKQTADPFAGALHA